MEAKGVSYAYQKVRRTALITCDVFWPLVPMLIKTKLPFFPPVHRMHTSVHRMYTSVYTHACIHAAPWPNDAQMEDTPWIYVQCLHTMFTLARLLLVHMQSSRYSSIPSGILWPRNTVTDFCILNLFIFRLNFEFIIYICWYNHENLLLNIWILKRADDKFFIYLILWCRVFFKNYFYLKTY